MARAPGARRRAERARVLLGALAGALVLVACSGDDADDEQAVPDSSHLVPSFPPEDDSDSVESVEDEDPPEEPDPEPPEPDEAPPPEPDTPDDDEAATPAPEPEDPDEADADTDGDSAESVEEETVTSMVTDPEGDTTSPLLGSAPDWADLIAGAVERTGTGDVTLTIELAEPPQEPDDGTTMNVASFHDLTGDGDIDLEVWLNLSEQGWFPAWRDNRDGDAAFGDDAGLDVEVEGATIEVVVPADLVGRPTSWRWSLGLEWGRYEWLGTEAAAHDLAPDEGFVPHG